MINGVDISVMQGVVDFAALAASGIQFVIIRCGVGNDGIDSKYLANVAAAHAAGLKVMAYHFVYPLPPLTGEPLRDPVKQAQYHFNAVAGQLAACDFEWPVPEDWAKWGCTPAQITQWCLTYLQEYEALSGRKMVIYTYPYFAQNLNLPAVFAQYPLWIASYDDATPLIPAPWTDWVIWQNNDHGSAAGISVEVDLDVAKDLSLWDGVPVVVPPAPPPTPAPSPTPVPVPIPIPTPVPAPPVQQAQFGIVAMLINFLKNFFKSGSV